jgi:hypothetical protein
MIQSDGGVDREARTKSIDLSDEESEQATMRNCLLDMIGPVA